MTDSHTHFWDKHRPASTPVIIRNVLLGSQWWFSEMEVVSLSGALMKFGLSVTVSLVWLWCSFGHRWRVKPPELCCCCTHILTKTLPLHFSGTFTSKIQWGTNRSQTTKTTILSVLSQLLHDHHVASCCTMLSIKSQSLTLHLSVHVCCQTSPWILSVF